MIDVIAVLAKAWISCSRFSISASTTPDGLGSRYVAMSRSPAPNSHTARSRIRPIRGGPNLRIRWRIAIRMALISPETRTGGALVRSSGVSISRQSGAASRVTSGKL